MCCDLEVDVNGKMIFLVDKRKIMSFSARLNKMFGKFMSTVSKLKLIFPDFPGGAECFELILRFCYNKGIIDITPSNVFLLYCGANYMEMNFDKPGVPNLVKQTELYLKSINYWTWSEFIVGLKQCQDLSSIMNSTCIFEEFLNNFVRILPLPFVSSPSTSSSSDSGGFQFSGDISTKSTKNSNYQTLWWFEDLVFLSIDNFEKLVKTMLLHNIDHHTIFSLLFYYQKSRFTVYASPSEKHKTMKTIINLLCLLDEISISPRAALYAFGMALSLKMRGRKIAMLEKLIGSKLDEANVDHLLAPSPSKKSSSYDVNLVIRLIKSFLQQSGNIFFLDRLKKVAFLIDLFMSEVAPDPWLKPSKFITLAKALPEFARDSNDKMYQAIDMYIEVHCGLNEEEKIEMCSMLNLNKLSVVSLNDLAENTNFPRGLVGNARFLQHPKSISFRKDEESKIHNQLSEDDENMFVYAENIDFPPAYEKLHTNFPASRFKSRLSNAKSIPGLC